jgi:YVTN family beta-propeller protein
MLSRIGALLALLCCAAPSIAKSVMTNIALAGTPAGVAVNPGNNRIYVGLVNQSDYSVSVIDGATNSVIDNVPLSTGALVMQSTSPPDAFMWRAAHTRNRR